MCIRFRCELDTWHGALKGVINRFLYTSLECLDNNPKKIFVNKFCCFGPFSARQKVYGKTRGGGLRRRSPKSRGRHNVGCYRRCCRLRMSRSTSGIPAAAATATSLLATGGSYVLHRWPSDHRDVWRTSGKLTLLRILWLRLMSTKLSRAIKRFCPPRITLPLYGGFFVLENGFAVATRNIGGQRRCVIICLWNFLYSFFFDPVNTGLLIL